MLSQHVLRYCECTTPVPVTIYDGRSTLYQEVPTIVAQFCDNCKREIDRDEILRIDVRDEDGC